MAHFAEIDNSNIVLRVLVVPDEQEQRGQAFLADDLGLGGVWVQTSYNGTIRRRFAAVGGSYDPVLDAFLPPRPFPSWTLDAATLEWVPPIVMPEEGGPWVWDELSQGWVAQ